MALMNKITEAEKRTDSKNAKLIDDLKCSQVEYDFFSVNQSTIGLRPNKDFKLFGPWCVDAGKTFDYTHQVTIGKGADDVFLSIRKNGTIVALSGVDDSEEPSSLSLIYRETVPEDSEFEVFIYSPKDTSIYEKYMQMGFKIYGDCQSAVTNVLPTC